MEPVANKEKVPQTDSVVSDFMSLNIMLSEVLDDFLLLGWIMLEGLFCLSVRPRSSTSGMHSRSLALLFSMSLFTTGEVYVT